MNDHWTVKLTGMKTQAMLLCLVCVVALLNPLFRPEADQDGWEWVGIADGQINLVEQDFIF